MKIIFVASEMVPFAKTGGLADVIGSLSSHIQSLGHDVRAFLPRYKVINVQQDGFQVVMDRLEIPLGQEKEVGRVYKTRQGEMDVYLVDHPEFFCRDGLYGTAMGDYPDNDRRYVFFQRAVLETLVFLKEKADIIHCHDWQTGLIPVYLKTLYASKASFKKTKSVFTIHNLGYQGNFPPDSLPVTGLSWDLFKMEQLEFYGKVSFLKGALVYADAITTVSERYAQEIQTKEFGAGLEGVLANRKGDLFGIVNGIDYEEWDPATIEGIAAHYDFTTLDKKAVNKEVLQRENELKVDPEMPLCGMVSRLVDQKGLDILVPVLGELNHLGLQFVLLGTGEEKYHHILREIAKKKQGWLGLHILFDVEMAKRIYAGCDLMVFPSYYEPCGLGHMIAMRFATIPIARQTGGLADTVQEFNPGKGTGNGFVFKEYTSEALREAIQRALRVFGTKKHWRQVVKNAMGCDFSWRASAKKYLNLYQMVLHGTSQKGKKER